MQTQSQDKTGLKALYTIGSVAAFLQLAAIVGYSIALGVLGPKPTSAEEFYAVQQSGGALEVILRGDFLLLILIGLYIGTFPTLYAALRKISPTGAFFAALCSIIVAVATFSSESTFSMLHLGDMYAAATSEAQRAQLIAAGEAVIASDMWNNSGAYVGGILLQGSGVLISIIMLRSKDFSKVTAISGLLGNGIDLVQHTIHYFAGALAATLQMVMGPFYFVWFIMLGLNLLRLAKRTSEASA
jgi:hypothetical protein